MSEEVLATREVAREGPIPSAWRPPLRDIVKAFVRGDFKISAGVPGLAPVSDDVSEQIRAYLADYGEELVELPDETWESSVCIWTGDHWDVLVDLWTAAEGRSDLVLRAFVTESSSSYTYRVHMVYVP